MIRRQVSSISTYWNWIWCTEWGVKV